MEYTLKKRYITIKKQHDGERLDKIIPIYLQDFSRGKARKLIAGGSVFINGRRIRKNSRPVLAGQTVAVYDSRNPEPDAGMKLDVLYEDKWYIAISKPAGIPSEETLQGSMGTVPFILTNTMGFAPVTVVHRLDMRTSGVMLISRTPAATKLLHQQFRERTIEKNYIALVHGILKQSSAEIRSRLGRDPEDPRKSRSVESGGKIAVTRYQVLSESGVFSLVSINILTGRTHQIRVHMSEAGHPIVGDHLYGVPGESAPRLMLHARSIAFDCPRTGHRRTVFAPVPAIFTSYSGIDYPWQ